MSPFHKSETSHCTDQIKFLEIHRLVYRQNKLSKMVVTYPVSLDTHPTPPTISPNLPVLSFLNVNNHNHSGMLSLK